MSNISLEPRLAAVCLQRYPLHTE